MPEENQASKMTVQEAIALVKTTAKDRIKDLGDALKILDDMEKQKQEVSIAVLETCIRGTMKDTMALWVVVDNLFDIDVINMDFDKQMANLLFETMSKGFGAILETIKKGDLSKDVNELKEKFDLTFGELQKTMDRINSKQVQVLKEKGGMYA